VIAKFELCSDGVVCQPDQSLPNTLPPAKSTSGAADFTATGAFQGTCSLGMRARCTCILRFQQTWAARGGVYACGKTPPLYAGMCLPSL
jgi:hypothetical protein